MTDRTTTIVKTEVRLWAGIEAWERVTAADIEAIYGPNSRRPGMTPFGQEILARMVNPHCECAIFESTLGRKWRPCMMPTAPGATRCKRHGGPPVRAPKPPSINMELQRIRAGIERALSAKTRKQQDEILRSLL